MLWNPLEEGHHHVGLVAVMEVLPNIAGGAFTDITNAAVGAVS